MAPLGIVARALFCFNNCYSLFFFASIIFVEYSFLFQILQFSLLLLQRLRLAFSIF